MDDLKSLIPVSYDNPERPTVSGRELHEFLGVKSRYNDWFNNMIACGFSENVDYVSLTKNLVNGGRSTDHQLTIPMAKELCMIQRNERGKQARQYFLAIEAQWNSPEAVMRRAVLIAQKQNDQLKAANKQLLAENGEMEPWAKFGKAYHSSPENSMLLREFAANVLKPNGIPLGEKDLFKYFEDHGYLVKNKKAHDYHRPTEKAANAKEKASGLCSTGAAYGWGSTAEVSGKDSIAVANGYKSKARGAIGCYIVLTEYDDDGNMLLAKMAKVDGSVIKENTWYTLKNGEFVERKA